MKTTKKQAIVIGIAATFIAVLLIPIAVYGWTVNTAEIETKIGFESSLAASYASETGLSVLAVDVPCETSVPAGPLGVMTATASAEHVERSGYSYAWSQLTDDDENGVDEGPEMEIAGLDVVNLNITFKLETPTGQNITIEKFGLGGASDKVITMILGPDELEEPGEYTLYITIDLIVTPLPSAGWTAVELHLELPGVSFTIPN